MSPENAAAALAGHLRWAVEAEGGPVLNLSMCIEDAEALLAYLDARAAGGPPPPDPLPLPNRPTAATGWNWFLQPHGREVQYILEDPTSVHRAWVRKTEATRNWGVWPHPASTWSEFATAEDAMDAAERRVTALLNPVAIGARRPR